MEIVIENILNDMRNNVQENMLGTTSNEKIIKEAIAYLKEGKEISKKSILTAKFAPKFIPHVGNNLRERKMNFRKLIDTIVLGIFAAKYSNGLSYLNPYKGVYIDEYKQKFIDYNEMYIIDFVKFYNNVSIDRIIVNMLKLCRNKNLNETGIPTEMDMKAISILTNDPRLYIDSNVNKFFANIELEFLLDKIGIQKKNILATNVDEVIFFPDRFQSNYYRFESLANDILANYGHKINSNKSGIIR